MSLYKRDDAVVKRDRGSFRGEGVHKMFDCVRQMKELLVSSIETIT